MKFVAALPITAAAILMTGCGSSTETAAPSTTPAASTSTSPPAASPTKATSQRNNLVKQIGEEAAFGKAGEPPVIRWKVTSISVDEPCTSAGSVPPVNGHFVSAAVEFETTPAFASEALPGGVHPANNWAIVDADGVTQPRAFSDAAARCHPAEWPVELAPGSKYRFRVTFDSRTPTGVLTFVPMGWANEGGWEWKF